MFKSGRWKTDNNKIKVMFQLQFHATQVPKMKGKGLTLALIPEDNPKPVAKLGRVPIADGACTWKELVYETVKLVKDEKTETYKKRIYYFNVQAGSSKSGFVGEVGVDLANFAQATEPVQLTLPLTASNTGAILHVFIQKMQRIDEPRVSEENESLLSESFRSKNRASDCIENGSMLDIANRQEQHYTEASKNEVQVLKSEVSWLERRAELSELELESLRKQILKESKRSQDLSRTIDELREEKEALETECDDIGEQLEYEKGINKKLVTKVRDFDRKMEEKNAEISHLSEIKDGLYSQLEVERKEKEELKIQNENISLDCKLLLQENDDMSSKSLTTIKEYEFQVKRLEEKIMNQALEISKSFDANAELETHIKRLEEELEKQGHYFEDEVQDPTKLKIEQEERIKQAEEALRKSELTNAAAVEKSRQEILRIKETHKQQVQKLCVQIDQKTKRIKQMSLELEASKNHGQYNYDLAEFNSLKKESTSWKSLMSEKNITISTLKSEIKLLTGDYNDLQQRLSVTESEKANLQKQNSKLEQKHLNLLMESKGACDVNTSKHEKSRSIFESGKSNEERCPDKELSNHICNYNDEISSLVERNKHIENELKEMQEKYTEVSLRFAEVESEREQLVMALRSLRNGKKK